MGHIKLLYFDFSGGRGEECRLALHLAGVAFEDVRIAGKEWPELKPKTPFGAMPVMEIEGLGQLAQSVAILTWIGRTYSLHPGDLWQAAQHEALMLAGEELRSAITPTGDIEDAAQKKSAREALAQGRIPSWAASTERQIAGPFVAGDKVNVVDVKLYMLVKWLRSGIIDHIPKTVLDPYPKLNALHDAFVAHPKVREWQSR